MHDMGCEPAVGRSLLVGLRGGNGYEAGEPVYVGLGAAEQVALVDDVRRALAQEIGLGTGLHTFGHHAQAKVAGHRQNGFDQRAIVGIGGRLGHKRSVNLQLLNGQPLEVGQ